ncbi:MAG: alpha-(1-_3)-arabinofuranosyltransferase family protein [Acidimicrobiales bacterium]
MTRTNRPAPRQALPYLAFAALCYVPLVLTRPGWLSADTKSYLYIDPGRLLSRAWSMWDPQIGLGTVSHQTIGYLWPMGPWYWAFEQLGVPDWLAQRLWWGTLLFLAGAGVVYLLRRFDWPSVAIWPAALVYAMTPYVLTHIGRLSGVLLPYVGLPWMLALTVLSIRSQRWRHPALFALLVTTVGSINLTALVLAGLGPVIWVVYVAVTGQERLAQLLRAVGRMAVLTVATSLWWLAGLAVQASHGIDIVRYTETAEVVARTSTAFEVLRGLGYWFFYGGDKLQLWLEVSYHYTQRPWLLAVTFAVPGLALLGPAIGRWRHQAFAVALLVVGALVAIGAHPWGDPSPFGRALQWFLATERGLAFRSLPRVAPLVALGSALLIGTVVGTLASRWPRQARAGAVAVVALAVAGLAPLWQRSLVNDNLSRQEIPAYWHEAAGTLASRDDGTRILELPGSDFASYRWGMTVDPITPGLTDRPSVSRELVPHGGAMGADLLNALDLRLQENTIDPDSIAPVARLMRAGDVLVRSDLEFERHNTARPRTVWRLVTGAPGLEEPIGFGEPVPNEAGPILQHLDEQWLLYEGTLPDPPPVAVFDVADAPPIVSAKPAEAPLLLSGDGAGIVDAAAAELIDGTELIRYTGSLDAEEIEAELAGGATLLLTDTNRKRGERWGALRHNRGHTERLDESPLRDDLADNRLARFPDAPPSAQTVAIQRGGVTADATAYGNPITYAGEERAARAVDGDPRTAWGVGVFSDARGERLRVQLDDPLAHDWIRLQQMSPDDSNRVLTEVRITFDGTDHLDVELDPSSWEEPGQLITFPARETDQVEIEIVADTAGDPPRFGEFGPVGIAELTLGPDSPTIDEIIKVPTHAVDAAGDRLATAPLGMVLTRIRQDPTDRTRGDEERSIRRLVELGADRSFSVDAVVRLSARAEDPVIDQLIGHTSPEVTVSATDRMDGSRRERAAAAFDGDAATAWKTPWGQPTGHTLAAEVARPRTFDGFDLEVVTDGRHSVPSRLRVTVDGAEVAVVDIAEPDHLADPGATTTVPVEFPATEGERLAVEVVAAHEVRSIDWTEARPLAHPIGIAELGVPGLTLGPAPERIDTGCRDDLVHLDGRPVPVRVTGSTEDAMNGRPLSFTRCDPDPMTLEAGDNELLVARGVDTGLDVDQLVLWSDAPEPPASPDDPAGVADIEIIDERPHAITAEVAGLEPGRPVWLVLGQNLSTGWTASAEGVDLGEPRLVDGYANGWLVHPDSTEITVELAFAPQGKVNLALAGSAIGVLVCLAAIVLSRGDRPRRDPAPPLRPDPSPWRYDGQQPSAAAAVAAAAGVGVGAAVFGPPLVAVALAIVAGLGARFARARPMVALLPAGLFGLAALYVIVWQLRHSIQPGMEWVGELERAHPIALAAILALPIHPLLRWLWSRGRPHVEDRTPQRDTATAAN